MIRRTPSRRVRQIGLGVVLVAAISFLCAPPASAAVQVTGEGASFPLIEIEQWRADVARPPLNLQIVYNGTSSGQGREEFKAGRVDFGVSDIPYPPGAEPGFEFAYVPLSAGGIAFMFNLKDVAGRRVRDLKLTPVTSCKVLTGQITKWTDPELVADNPKFVSGYLSTDKIKVIMRSGAAGTSYILGEYCQQLAPAVWQRFTVEGPGFAGGVPWSNHPGPPLSQWPAPPGGANAGSSDQNANTVASEATGAGAITAVETGFARERNFPVASVRNDTATFVQPTEPAVTRALSYAGKDPRGTQKLVYNPGDPAAYNPSSYSYAIVKTGPNSMESAKGNVLAQFLNYSAGAGQLRADSLGYAPLSQNLIDVALDVVSRIAGAPPKASFDYAAAVGGGGNEPSGSNGTPAGGGGGAAAETPSPSAGSANGPRGGTPAGGGGDGSGNPTGGAPTVSGSNTGTVPPGAVAVKVMPADSRRGAAGSDGTSELALMPFPVQPTSTNDSDSVVPLGWILALGALGYFYGRHRNRQAQP